MAVRIGTTRVLLALLAVAASGALLLTVLVASTDDPTEDVPTNLAFLERTDVPPEVLDSLERERLRAETTLEAHELQEVLVGPPLAVLADGVLHFNHLRPPHRPLRFDLDATLRWSSPVGQLTVALVGGGRRLELARCMAGCDGRVEVGHLRATDGYLIEVGGTDGWDVRVTGATEVGG